MYRPSGHLPQWGLLGNLVLYKFMFLCITKFKLTSILAENV